QVLRGLSLALSIELAKWRDVLWYTDSRRSPRVERPNGGPDPAHCLISGNFTVCLTETALEIVIRPTEVDVNGHVNNAKYVDYGVGARGVVRASGASLRPAFRAWGRDRDGEPEPQFSPGVPSGRVSCDHDSARAPGPDQLRPSPGDPQARQHARRRRCDTLVTIDPATRKNRPVPDDLYSLPVVTVLWT